MAKEGIVKARRPAGKPVRRMVAETAPLVKMTKKKYRTHADICR
jgi:hypothetical protein